MTNDTKKLILYVLKCFKISVYTDNNPKVFFTVVKRNSILANVKEIYFLGDKRIMFIMSLLSHYVNAINTLRALIFAGIKFREFREFLKKSRNLILAKIMKI